MTNPFDALDDSAQPAAPRNPFDALGDDRDMQDRIAANPDLQEIMSRFARSRVDDIASTARMVPNPEAFTTLDERARGKAVQGELQAAEDLDTRAQAAVRDAKERGDASTYGAAVEAAGEAGRRLAQARKLDDDIKAGMIRQASPQQQLALGNAVAAQKKRVGYLSDQIEQAEQSDAFLPDGRKLDDLRAELRREMKTLYTLESGQSYGAQREAFSDPSALGEMGRGLARGAMGTVPEMLGGAAKQAGMDGVADVLREFGRGVRRDTTAEAAGEFLKLGEKESLGKDLKNYVSAKLGEGVGTSLPVIASYMSGGGATAAVATSAALGIGQMRNSLEDAFASEGVAFPEEHAARYVLLYGTAIGALESLTEIVGMRALTGEAKRQVVRSIGQALARGAAKGAAMEGGTEALQEAIEMYGVSDATGKPLDMAEVRRRMAEGLAAGAIPGAAFGTFTGVASNKSAFDVALEKAKELGFGDAPQKPQDGQPSPEAATPAAPAETPPAATVEPASTEAPQPAPITIDPVAAEQTGNAVLDVVDSIIPAEVQVDREMVAETAASVADAIGIEVQPIPEAGEFTDDEIASIVDMWSYVQDMEKAPKPKGLVDFIRDRGGVVDDGFDVRSQLGGANQRPGLVSSKGRALDDAALMAFEAGYFTERPTVAEFLDALDRDQRGDPVVRLQDVAYLEDYSVAQDMRNELDKLGVAKARTEEDVRRYLTPQNAAAGRSGAGGRATDSEPTGIDLDAYLAEGGSLSKSALPGLAKRLGVTEPDLPALLDKAVDAGTLRKTAGGMYRRATAPDQKPEASEFRRAERQRQAMEAIDEALKFGRQILPKGVNVTVRDEINVGGYDLDAYSETREGHIALAMFANNPKARLGHEGLHTLVTRGHISPDELSLLAETARTSGVWTAKAEAQYRDAYAGRTNIDAMISEEAAAHLVEARIRGADFGQQANTIIDKLKKLLEHIRKTLQGRGFKTADDVLDALLSGEMANRDARTEWMRSVRDMMQARAKEGVELPGGVRVEGVPLFAIRAFHGSPHDFDRFSLDKIGTGEGAQAFGHGLYFAEQEAVAKSYQNKLSRRHSGVTEWTDDPVELGEYYVDMRGREAGLQEIDRLIEIYTPGLFSRWSDPERYKQHTKKRGMLRAARDAIKDGRVSEAGRMYEVRIAADPDDFLDWDKPLSQQSEKVRGVVGDQGVGRDGYYRASQRQRQGERNGDPLDDVLFDIPITDHSAAAARLREAGIPGIKYLDQGSRAEGEGSRNYVVFDDSLIEIVAKDGVPVAPPDAMFALADIETGRSMRQDLDALGYYSALLEAAKALRQSKGTPEQMLAMLKKEGAKEAEIEATGLKSLFDGKTSVTRDEIIAHLEGNRVGMKEKSYDRSPPTDDELARLRRNNGSPESSANLLAALRLPFLNRKEPLAGINSIVRDLAHDLGITVRQGLTTPAAKKAKRQARRAGTDISSYYDPATGVLRVTSMSDLTAILTHAGEAIVRRYDAMKAPRDVLNPLERLIGRHAYGLLGTYRGRLFGQIDPKYSGVSLPPLLRETLSQYLLAWHNDRVANMNRSRDPGGYAKAQRDLLNARRNVARYMGSKLQQAIDLEQQNITSVWGLVQGQVPIEDIRDYVEIRYNRHTKITPPPPADPLDPETQRAAFGKWFTTYVTDRSAAEAQDPALFEAFEDLLDTTDPVLSAKLDSSTDAIVAHAKAAPEQIIASMVSSPKRIGKIAEFFSDVDRGGLVPTLADGLRMLYRGGWDDLHPWYTAVRQLLEIHRINIGSKLDIEATENAYKLLRLGRHSGAWAGRDLEDGIRARASNRPEGPSLVQALQMALGSDRATALNMEPDGRYARFGQYLIARRSVRLWDRFYAGTLQNPPVNASRETSVDMIQKMEGEFPEFVGAADLVYEFQNNLLRLQRDAGIITAETYDTLSKEPDYVPFIRDMTDKDQSSSRVLRGAQSIIRKIKGSDRNIMDPISTIAQKVYETRQIIATNDAKLALLRLADAAGPGGGAIAERLDATTSKAMRVNLQDALRSAADDMGVSRADANALVELAQQMLGDQMAATVFGKGQINTAGQHVTWVYENGIPVPVKLADGHLGEMMMQTLQTFGDETTNILIDAMAIPAAVTRATVTAHPTFIIRNGFVDGLMAWMYAKEATPWVTQARGFVEGLRESERVRAYGRNAGLMGGPATSALDKLRFDRDVEALVARGYQPKVWTSPLSFMRELVRHPLRNISLMSEASETGTRARLYEIAFERATKSGLNAREAAAEAAFFAHDYMDYSRHGATLQKWGKLVPFMNAALQGMDRYARLLMAKGDYGSAWGPYINYRLGRVETLDLTEREKAELAQSAQAWMVSTLVMGGISLAVSLLWAMRGDDDLEDIPPEVRATHWVVPLDGVYHLVPKELPGIREALKGSLDDQTLRLPKGFDNAWFANLVERLMIDARTSNPRWFENYLGDLSSILSPPMEPQAVKMFYEMKTGQDFFSGRDIIPKWKQERFPEMMWDEYTSEFAKWVGKKTGTAPYYIDHAMKQIGTSWARDALSLNVPGLPWYDPLKPEKTLDDYFIARRFLWKVGKGSEAAGKVREIMGAGDPMRGVAGRLSAPYSRLDAAAETYKEYLKRRDPASASDFLDRLRPAERAYAILDANVEGDSAKLKMIHPIHRADKVLAEASGLQKEVLGNLVESRKRKKGTGELIPLDPSEKRAAIDILMQFKMMEAHNALVVSGEVGYAQRDLFDTGAVLAELRAAVPNVADEFEKRLKKAHVIPFAGVRAQWPMLRQELESPALAALSKEGDKRGIVAKVREFYTQAKIAE